ncbi:MAG: hypothetical protein E6G93_09175 [Alphaproteobacteria bacterium]|nr:MAG: hypothetical protein E6G93_09175 [Alphaproteobacteria bacterium]
MPASKKIGQKAIEGHPVDRKPVSSIKLPSALTASIDAWASTHAFNRSQAIRRLVELGLKWEAAGGRRQVLSGGAVAVEEMVARQLDQIIDPATPKVERARRIHRLTEGPPEFVDVRIDLPKREH